MNTKRAFTLIELLVVISVIAILLAILMPSLKMAKEAGQRIACLGNLKGLQMAWELYANANDDKIVNGEQDGFGTDGKCGARNGNEQYWCGDDTTPWQELGRTHLAMPLQISAIQAGALYPYIKSLKLYHCPTGIRNEWRNYAIVDSMNGRTQDGRNVLINGASKVVGDTVVYIKRKAQIKKPPASMRLVFGDEGMATADSIATFFMNEYWWDPAQVRHSNGNTYTFADGHAEYWKWKGKGTIQNGRLAAPVQSFRPVSDDDFKDLYKFQIAVWGVLGYTPTHPMI